MPSRRPPSQRDPAYALHRLPAAVKQILPGTTVRNSTPVARRQLAKIAAAAAGGGPLGWALVSLGAASPTSNGTAVNTGGATLSLEVGHSDLTFSGGTIQLQTSGDPCLYLVTLSLQADPTTNALSTDVHQYTMDDGNGVGGFVMSIGTAVAVPTTTAQVICFPGAPGFGVTPTVSATCTAGTNRSYNLVPYLYYTRFPFPS